MLLGLNEFFTSLEKDGCNEKQEDLFGFSGEIPCSALLYEKSDIDLLSSYFRSNFDPSALVPAAQSFYMLCTEAFDCLIHAWMSGLAIERQMLAFMRFILDAAENEKGSFKEKKNAAWKAAHDRSNENTITVLEAAYKVQHEIHRFYGLLRFTPVYSVNDKKEIFIARCESDHFILPALGEYFSSRFGETAWVVADEKRQFALRRFPGEQWQIFPASCLEKYEYTRDEWEELWQHYHKTINNESRNNSALQRQLMPKRYWKNLTEMKKEK